MTAPAAQPTTILYTVTGANPRSPATGWDAGQRGWRLHAIEVKDGEAQSAYHKRPSLCGLSPSHGWGFDMFIDTHCTRCMTAIAKREASGETFADLGQILTDRRMAEWAEKQRLEDWFYNAENPVESPSFFDIDD